MSKDLKVVWTENAVQDLLLIKDYISQDSTERATSWLLELINAGESLSSIPDLNLDLRKNF